MFKCGNSVAAFALAAAIGAVSAGGASAQAPSLDVANQKLTRNTVRIADVNLPQNGFVVIRASDANGRITDNVVGFRALGPGDHKNVKVRLTGTHKTGETLWAVAQQNNGSHPGAKRDKSNIGPPFLQDGKMINKSFSTM